MSLDDSGALVPLCLTPTPTIEQPPPPPPASEEAEDQEGKGKKKKKSGPQDAHDHRPMVEDLSFNSDGSLVAAVFRHKVVGLWRTAPVEGQASLLAER